MGRIVSIHEYDLKPGVNLWGTPSIPGPRGSIQIPGRSGRKTFSLPF
jgi:hypothetical protein